MNAVFKLKNFITPYWKRSIGALFLLAAVVVMDLSIPWLIRRIIDHGITEHNQGVVIHTALIMLGMSMLSALFAIGNNMLSVQVGEGVARDLRDSLFVKIQSFSFGNLDKLKTGQLIVRLTSDVNAFKTLTQITLRIGTRAPLLMIGSLILMFDTSKSLALTMLPVLIVTSIIITFFIFKTEPLYKMVQQKLDRLNTVLQENISGVRVVKAFVRSFFESKRFEAANTEFTDESVKVMQFMSLMIPSLTILVNVGVVIVVWLGGIHVINGEMSVGQIVAFINYLLTTMIPLIMMTMLANVWASGIASAKRINEVFDSVPEIQDQKDAIEFSDDMPGRIVFNNVSFRYNGNGGESVLDGVNLVIEPGQTVAILGATGSGKTTLINLVPRFYDAVSGSITIDNIDIHRFKNDSILSQIGIVPQENILFSGSVKENISYGKAGAGIEEVIDAAKTAQADDFISALPDGYDTHVVQRGSNFSGGQKQRIAIARAVLPNPKILIFDDSTSAVDVETETKIQDALESRNKNHTVLIVAQRISTVLKADKIVVLDKGKICAEGTHKELMQTCQIYQEIYKSQLGDGFSPEDFVTTEKGDTL